MKVIHVASYAAPYGIGSFLWSLLQYQRNNYDDLEVAVAFHIDHENTEKFKKINIPVYSMSKKSAKEISLVYEFFKIFRNYDIVNLHSYSPWAFIAALCTGKKIIYTFHGSFGLTGLWKDIFLRSFYKHFVNRFSKKITFASKTSLSIYLSKLRCTLNKEKTDIFPYGLLIKDIVPLMPRDGVRKDLSLLDNYVIGTVARMDSVKKIERLIESFLHFPDKKAFRLVIVGSGESSYQDYLLKFVNKQNLEKYVRFLGYREDIYDLINVFDFFVLPSRKETFGMALLEAMALGIPSAVFSDGGGVVDIIGIRELIVKDSKELCDLILKVKNDEQYRTSIAHQLKMRASEFDISYTANSFHNLYKEIN